MCIKNIPIVRSISNSVKEMYQYYFPLITKTEVPTISKILSEGGKRFGCATEAKTASSMDRGIEHLLLEFRRLTPENSLKFGSIRPQRDIYDFSVAEDTISIANANNMPVHGHNFVWSLALPDWIIELPGSEGYSIMIEHITEVWNWATPYKHLIDGWDIINEPWIADGSLVNGYWRDEVGEDYVVKFLEHSLSLGIPSCVNTHIVTKPILDNLCRLADNGLINQAGFQFHWRYSQSINFSELDQAINYLGSKNVETRITELDVATPVPYSQSQYDWWWRTYCDIFTWLKYSPITNITVWNMSDVDSWIPLYFPGWGNATLWNNTGAGNRKPVYENICDLLK